MGKGCPAYADLASEGPEVLHLCQPCRLHGSENPGLPEHRKEPDGLPHNQDEAEGVEVSGHRGLHGRHGARLL